MRDFSEGQDAHPRNSSLDVGRHLEAQRMRSTCEKALDTSDNFLGHLSNHPRGSLRPEWSSTFGPPEHLADRSLICVELHFGRE